MPSLGSGLVNRINTPFRAVIITLLDRHKPAYLSMSRIYHITTYCHGDVPVGGQVGGSAGRHQIKYIARHITIYLYLDLS